MPTPVYKFGHLCSTQAPKITHEVLTDYLDNIFLLRIVAVAVVLKFSQVIDRYWSYVPVATQKTHVELFKTSCTDGKTYNWFFYYPDFCNDVLGGWGIVMMTRNDLLLPKMAEIWRILCNGYNKSYIYNGSLMLLLDFWYCTWNTIKSLRWHIVGCSGKKWLFGGHTWCHV